MVGLCVVGAATYRVNEQTRAGKRGDAAQCDIVFNFKVS